MKRCIQRPRSPNETERFGKLYAELTAAPPSDARLAAQRARMVLRVRREGVAQVTPRWYGLLWPGVAAALAIVLVVTFAWQADREPALTATWQGREVNETATFEGGQGDAAVLAFSDGSEVRFAENARAAMVRVQPKDTELSILRGRLDADINKKTGAKWTVAAGPYRVHVVGTRFSVEWDPESGRFSVDVTEGRVMVTGEGVQNGGVAVTAGQNVVRTNDSESRQPKSDGSPQPKGAETAAEQSAAVTPDPVADAPIAKKARKRVRSNDAREQAEPSATSAEWVTFARRGEYAAAFAASREGFDAALRSEGAEQLLLLAKSARYAGHAGEARRAYSTLRERFPGSSSASLAAYYLARIAQDVEGRPTDAVRWLRVHLREAGAGPLAGSARARLMDTLRKMGDEAGAKAAARDYLSAHPKGAHASVARSIIGHNPAD